LCDRLIVVKLWKRNASRSLPVRLISATAAKSVSEVLHVTDDTSGTSMIVLILKRYRYDINEIFVRYQSKEVSSGLFTPRKL